MSRFPVTLMTVPTLLFRIPGFMLRLAVQMLEGQHAHVHVHVTRCHITTLKQEEDASFSLMNL